MDMLKMLLKVIFIVHLLACLTFLVATPLCPDSSMGPCRPHSDDDVWTNWVRMFQIDEFNLETRYLATFHFITATLMAVGYGDIFPSNSLERIVCIVSQITGAVLFGFLLSCITAVLEFTNPMELEHKKRMAEIKDSKLASGTQPSPKLEDTGGAETNLRELPREFHHSIIWKAMENQHNQSMLGAREAAGFKSLHQMLAKRMIFQSSSSTELITCDENLFRLLFPADLQHGFGPILERT
ncbi:unnamed protein product [Cladocopium goreaui]|uniref:Potassium channel domain-containing protein n=1 Tax=Cladocopium goreaui TaxID=2562237 RepID=A0A9P1DW15_9DINO|nr:unnamed protein product [Cladocopium goreaui]